MKRIGYSPEYDHPESLDELVMWTWHQEASEVIVTERDLARFARAHRFAVDRQP